MASVMNLRTLNSGRFASSFVFGLFRARIDVHPNQITDQLPFKSLRVVQVDDANEHGICLCHLRSTITIQERWGKRELERQFNAALFCARAVLSPPKVSPSGATNTP
jgi:hypothetical protein